MEWVKIKSKDDFLSGIKVRMNIKSLYDTGDNLTCISLGGGDYHSKFNHIYKDITHWKKGI